MPRSAFTVMLINTDDIPHMELRTLARLIKAKPRTVEEWMELHNKYPEDIGIGRFRWYMEGKGFNVYPKHTLPAKIYLKMMSYPIPNDTVRGISLSADINSAIWDLKKALKELGEIEE